MSDLCLHKTCFRLLSHRSLISVAKLHLSSSKFIWSRVFQTWLQVTAEHCKYHYYQPWKWNTHTSNTILFLVLETRMKCKWSLTLHYTGITTAYTRLSQLFGAWACMLSLPLLAPIYISLVIYRWEQSTAGPWFGVPKTVGVWTS